MDMRVLVISGAPPNAQDAVGDFAWLLSKQLARECTVSFIAPEAEASGAFQAGDVSVVRVGKGWGFRAARQVLDAAAEIKPDVILVHFVPQLYGWNGAKPGFALLLRTLKRKGFRVVTIAHEFSAPLGLSPKLAFWAAAHRLVLRLLVAASCSVVLTNSLYAEIMKRWFPERAADIHRVPIGCTLPVLNPDIDDVAMLRQKHDIRADELVVATFGTPLESSAVLVAKLLGTISSEIQPVHCLIIGKAGAKLKDRLAERQLPGCRITATGQVSNDCASDLLSISDLYLALFPDGASTRRTSLMAGLAHGVPTISNKGVLTDSVISTSGALLLMNGATSDIDKLQQLAADSTERTELGARGRRFFEEHFSWEVIGQQYTRIMRDTTTR